MLRHKSLLLAGASAFALAVSAGPVLAADRLNPRTIVADAPVRSGWTWWLEGGGIMLDGDPGVAGMGNPPFDADPRHWGWSAAAGFDYRSPAGWIWSGQFRWDQNEPDTTRNNPLAVFNIGTAPVAFSANGTNSASRKEHHWVADFMVGRDMGLGKGMPNQVKFGVRVAEIRGTTKGSALWKNIPGTTTPSTCPTYCWDHQRVYKQTNRFLGVGPRLEGDGNVRLGERWSFEYMGGVAVLFGESVAKQRVHISTFPSASAPTGTVVLALGGPIPAKSRDTNAVFNLDAMAGLSYALGPNSKMTFSYRFDGYWEALRGFSSTGKATDLDRFYHGPMLRFTIAR